MNCYNGGTCSIDDSGKASCQCIPGYDPISQCSLGSCKNFLCGKDHICQLDKNRQPTCTCKDGYTGDDCKTPPVVNCSGGCKNGGKYTVCTLKRFFFKLMVNNLTISTEQLVLCLLTLNIFITKGSCAFHVYTVYFFSIAFIGLRRKSKDWLARNQDNMSEQSDMSTCRLLF